MKWMTISWQFMSFFIPFCIHNHTETCTTTFPKASKQHPILTLNRLYYWRQLQWTLIIKNNNKTFFFRLSFNILFAYLVDIQTCNVLFLKWQQTQVPAKTDKYVNLYLQVFFLLLIRRRFYTKLQKRRRALDLIFVWYLFTHTKFMGNKLCYIVTVVSECSIRSKCEIFSTTWILSVNT